MDRQFRGIVIAALVATLGLTACTSTNNSTPAPVPTVAPQNISGDYSGTLTDAQAGKGNATATLAQTGSNAGGAIAVTAGATTTSYQLSVALNATNGITGNMVTDLPTTQCSFSVTGSFDASTNVLSGSYTAVSGCSGDTGTFSLTQTCVATPSALPRRMTSPSHC